MDPPRYGSILTLFRGGFKPEGAEQEPERLLSESALQCETGLAAPKALRELPAEPVPVIPALLLLPPLDEEASQLEENPIPLVRGAPQGLLKVLFRPPPLANLQK